MSLATQLIRAAIEAGAPTYVRNLRVEHLTEEEQPVVTFVKDHLRRHGQLPSLVTLAENDFHINRVREQASYYSERITQRYAYSVINDRHPALVAAMRSADPNAAVAVIRDMVQAVGGAVSGAHYVSIADEASVILEDYEYAKLHPGLRGITYGWPTMDELTLGMQPAELDVTVGRPFLGKSYLEMENAYCAWRANHGIAIITMEMPATQYARRWVARHSGINPRMIRKGELSVWGESHLRRTIVDLQSENHAPVHIMSGDFNKNVDGIEAMVRQLDAEAIYIDAAYLLSPIARVRGSASKWEDLAQVIKELKQLGIAVNRPISITVQFNRNVKSNSTKELDLGDIGGTDAIPQDASIVRGVRYAKPPYQLTRRRISVLKNREGEVRDFEVHFQHTPMNFSEAPITEEQGAVSLEWMA